VKKVVLILVTCISCIFSLLSCQEDPITEVAEESPAVEFEALGEMPSGCDSLISASNPNNSYDYIGEDHNNALIYAADNMTTITTAGDSLFNLIIEYIENQGVSLSYQIHLDTTTQKDFDEFVSLDTNELGAGMSISNYRTSYIPSSDTVFNNFLSSVHDIIEGATDEQEAIDDLISFESEIKADNLTYSSDEKTIIMASLSVLRHSIKYWTEAELLECHPYHGFVTSSDDDLNNREASLRLDFFELLVDYLVMNDCLYWGGLGASNVGEAIDNCLPSGIYASVRAYDRIFPPGPR